MIAETPVSEFPSIRIAENDLHRYNHIQCTPECSSSAAAMPPTRALPPLPSWASKQAPHQGRADANTQNTLCVALPATVWPLYFCIF